MLTILLPLMALVFIPIYFAKSLTSEQSAIVANNGAAKGDFNEPRQLTNRRFDYVKIGVLMSYLLLALIYLYQIAYTNKTFNVFFDIQDAIILSFVAVSLPVLGLYPIRTGFVLMDETHVRAPHLFKQSSFPRNNTLVWINKIGPETYACVLKHHNRSSLLFLDNQSANLLRRWVVAPKL